MDKVLSYIGMCKLESGSVVIADPYINRIISLYEKNSTITPKIPFN